MALAIFAGTVTPALWLLAPARTVALAPQAVAALESIRRAMLPATLATGLTLLSGPFVAGNDAGRAYNNWPKMGYDWVPPEVVEFWKNPREKISTLFEDTAVIQFHHRLLAYTTVATAVGFGLRTRALFPLAGLSPLLAYSLPAIALAQMTLGITTLLMYVPTSLGVAHQGVLMLVAAMLRRQQLGGDHHVQERNDAGVGGAVVKVSRLGVVSVGFVAHQACAATQGENVGQKCCVLHVGPCVAEGLRKTRATRGVQGLAVARTPFDPFPGHGPARHLFKHTHQFQDRMALASP
jgi:cytochrome c oxidase assembly protein subunit 15